MDKSKALDKIKKCLALSKSANEHEAALALKEAQALMREYGISDEQIALSAITESDDIRTPETPAKWQAYLQHIICECFGVRCYGDFKLDAKQLKVLSYLKFYGMAGRAEIAAYAYAVLLRQLQADRRNYMKTKLGRVRIAKNKTHRADEYCMGWVASVHSKIDKFANGERENELLMQYREQLGLVKGSIRKSGKGVRSEQDRINGYRQGATAQIHHAMNGGSDLQQIGNAS